MLTKEISEVEKEIERFKKMEIYANDENINEEEYLLMQSEKLSTLKYAQSKFDKFVFDVKGLVAGHYSPRIQKELLDGIDELCKEEKE